MPAPDLFGIFLQRFNSTTIRYMVTGSVAATIYGEPRLTQDIDLVVHLARRDAEALAEAFPSSAYYVPPVEVLQVEGERPSGGHFNLLHLDTGLRADCYGAGESPLNAWGLDRRRPVIVAGETVWVAPPEYVILSKLDYFRQSGGERHLEDVGRMLRVSGEQIGRDDIERWVGRLGLEAAWTAALGWVGKR